MFCRFKTLKIKDGLPVENPKIDKFTSSVQEHSQRNGIVNGNGIFVETKPIVPVLYFFTVFNSFNIVFNSQRIYPVANSTLATG